MSFIYIAGTQETGPCKVGRSTNPYDRINTLQTGNPDILELFVSIGVIDAPTCEKLLHERLAPKRLHGEWFAASSFEVERELALILQERGDNPTPIVRAKTKPHRKEYLKLKARERRARERAKKAKP